MHTHKHSPDAHVEGKQEHTLLWALLLTAGFMVAEVIGGLISGSLALLADAGHMLTDTAALGLAWWAAHTSRRPADRLRTYGYQRAQVLAAFVNGVALLVVVGWILMEAIERLFQPVVIQGGLMMTIAVLGLLVNIAAFALLHRGDRENLNVQAALLHVLGDLLGSAASIIAAAVILWTGWTPVDTLVSLLVALLIFRSAWGIVRQSTHILLEGTPEGVDVEQIRSHLCRQVDGVSDVHHVHVWSLTPQRPMLTMHVRAKAETSHSDLLTHIKQELEHRFGMAHTTIQIEFDECPDD